MKNGQGQWKKVSGDDHCNQYSGKYKNDKKHGYGEFTWGTGSYYKGNYVDDLKQGYGEMYWVDGSIYRGFWHQGLQSGMGLMIFKDGLRKAGTFDRNVYQKPLVKMTDFEDLVNDAKFKIPEAFRQEVKEYVGLLAPAEDYSKFIGQEFFMQEEEDLMELNQFEHMQEMANAPFFPNTNITKEDYAKQVEEIEIAEAKAYNEQEPGKLAPDPPARKPAPFMPPPPPKPLPAITVAPVEERYIPPPPKLRPSDSWFQPPIRMSFVDFDYINPMTNDIYQGQVDVNSQQFVQMVAHTSKKSAKYMRNTAYPTEMTSGGKTKRDSILDETFNSTYSPGKSVYKATERGFDLNGK